MTDIDVRVTRARSQLIMDHPFFGALAMRLVPVARNDIRTLATDGKHLFYGPQFLDQSEQVLRMGVAHEVMHCALGHHTRRGNRDLKLWNIACDYVVNLLLEKAGFTMPDWAFCDPQYDGLNAEQIYRLLEKEHDESEQLKKEAVDWFMDNQDDFTREEAEAAVQGRPAGDGGSGGRESSPTPGQDGPAGGAGAAQPQTCPGCRSKGFEQSVLGPGRCTFCDGTFGGNPPTGPGVEMSGDPGGLGEVLDAAPAHDQAALEEAASEWQVYTRQAVNVARRAGEGRLPAFLEEVIEELNDPHTDWRTVLRRFVDPSNTKDYSWASPNRRYSSLGLYTPGFVSDGVNHVALVIDTSGSIDYQWLQQFGAEAQAALDDGAVDKVTVVFTDEQVHRTAEYARGEAIDFTVAGRGGTRFAPAFKWLDENASDLSAAIYFTDLDCTDFGEAPAYPVLWAVYGPDPRTTQRYMARVPFGECMELQ